MAAQNLIPDPGFAVSVAGWQALGPNVSLIRDTAFDIDVSGGAARLVVPSGPGGGTASICLPALPSQPYVFGGYLLSPPGHTGGSAYVSVTFFSDAACSVGAGLFAQSGAAGMGSGFTGQWQRVSGAVTSSPPSTSSLRFTVTSLVPGGMGDVVFDRVYVGVDGTVPEVTPPIPTVGRSGLWLLGIALASIGAVASRKALGPT